MAFAFSKWNRLAGLLTVALANLVPITGAVAAPPELPIVSEEAAPLPVTVTPGDPLIRYVGRFERGSGAEAAPRCSWSASAVTLSFTGGRLNVRLNDTSNEDRYQIVVDGNQAGVLAPKSGSHRYTIYPIGATAGTAGTHTVTLVKRTEAFVGVTGFEGFEVAAEGKLLPPPPAPKRRIEVIGDSISCGYGNEGANEKEHFTPKTENAYLTYGAIAARKLDAEYVCLAWSGRKMWPNNTMDEIYDRSLPTDAASKWDFTHWTPDVVVINLSTNDYSGKEMPADKDWITGYRAFIARVRKNYPRATIYCATSPMLWAEKDTRARQCLKQIVDEENQKGDANVRLLDFKIQNQSDGLGSDWHPSVKTHEIMADKLTATLEKDLAWKAIPR